jgi:general secretion pathway protein G
MKTKSKKGFSLVELLVVITIIAILSVVAYTAMGGQTITARDSKRKSDLSTVQSALELYYVQYSRYPSTLATGEATVADGWKIPRKYLSEIPKDPKSSDAVPLNYFYWTNDSEYILGATLENDSTPVPYVVGNSESSVSGGHDSGGGACTLEVGTTTCFPYKFD